mmetsp:Transcript_31723/g.69377  ORF Transcript_31723/g.69377 Transcript_31723/m.69377 type:complete len:416 (+) Transcript_31723:217-1464(+)
MVNKRKQKEGVEKSKRPANTAFKQQNLRAWRPILTPKAVIVTFFVVGVVFVPIGIVIYLTSQDIVEVESANYVAAVDDGGCCISDCDSSGSDSRTDLNPCYLTIEIPEDMEPPIYMYYRLTNFYQNHRMYIKSRDDAQLRGEPGLKPDDTEVFCKNGDGNVGWAVNYDSGGSANNTLSNVVSPCGLIANSLFNDSLRLVEGNVSGWREVEQYSTDISWASDRENKFKNAPDGSTGNNFPHFVNEKVTFANCTLLPTGLTPSTDQREACLAAKKTDAVVASGQEPGWCFPNSGFCAEDEHFIVWMRTAGLPSFRKLYARIEEKLVAGTNYSVQIWNGLAADPKLAGDPALSAVATPVPKLYPVHTFNGDKTVVLSTTAWIGGKNDFLGIAYMVVGAVCLVLAIAFAIKDRLAPRKS